MEDLEFEWDPDKSRQNLAKHGITFDQAQRLWLDDQAVEYDLAYPMEQRCALVGKIDGVFWTAVFTKRGDRIRLISVRRSRGREKEFYD